MPFHHVYVNMVILSLWTASPSQTHPVAAGNGLAPPLAMWRGLQGYLHRLCHASQLGQNVFAQKHENASFPPWNSWAILPITQPELYDTAALAQSA